MTHANVGENITLKMTGVTENDLCKGYVLCPQVEPARIVTKFKATIQVIELPEERPVMTSGYKAVLHVHVAIVTCSILIARSTALDSFMSSQGLGRFTLRDE